MQYKKLNASMVKRIEDLKNAKNMKWSDLAGASDVSTSALSDMKLGKVETKFSTLCKIAIGLNIEPKELFNFDPDLSELDI